MGEKNEDIQEKMEPMAPKKVREKNHSWKGMIIFLMIILVMRVFVVETIYVKGSSMEPNFQHGDWILIDKLSTSLGKIEKNDIVICEMHIDDFAEKIIKRVVGMPGDEINIVWNEDSENVEYALYINGEHIEEPYLSEPMKRVGDLEYPYIVPEGSYFVMGDNRNASSDSRESSIGAVLEENIRGKVRFRAYPFDQIGLI